MSSDPHEDSRAHVSLPAEMRPLLDRAQEALEAPSWSSTVQTLLEGFAGRDGAGRPIEKEALDRAKGEAVAEALERVAEALHFVLDAAGLEIDRARIGDALRAAAADADPLAFSRFALEVSRAVERTQDGEALSDQLSRLQAGLDDLQSAQVERPPPQVIVKNADAEADADADADADG